MREPSTLEEHNRLEWCVDKFMELASDMVANKGIPHRYVIVAMDAAHVEMLKWSVLPNDEKAEDA